MLALGIVFVVTRLVALVLVQPWDDDARQRFVTMDAEHYVVSAVNLAAGRGYSASTESPFTPNSTRPPGYSLFLAGAMVVLGDSLTALTLVNVALQALTLCLVYWGLRRVVPEVVAFLGALWWVLDPITIIMSMRLYSESLFQLLNVAAAWLLLWAIKTSRLRLGWAAVLGLCYGLSLLVRPMGMAFTPVMIVAVLLCAKNWKRGLALVAVFGACTGAVLLPWLVRNQMVFGHFAMSSLSGTTLTEYYAKPFLAASDELSQLRDLEKEVERRVAGEDSFERSERLSSYAKDVVLAQPIRYGFFHGAAIGPTLFGSGAKELPRLVADEYRDAASSAWAVNAWLVGGGILLLAHYSFFVLGLWVLAKRRLWLAALLMLAAFGFVLAISGPNSSSRYRLSFLPYTLVGAVIGAESLRKRISEAEASVPAVSATTSSSSL